MMVRLKAVADLGPYEINVGKLVAVRSDRNTLTGRLQSVPLESVTKPALVVRLGDYSTALHPADVVIVVPDGYKATVVIEQADG